MIYLSLDIETTGLCWLDHDTIEIGAVLVRPGLGDQVFRCLIQRRVWRVEPYCLKLHASLWSELAGLDELEGGWRWYDAGYCVSKPEYALICLANWLDRFVEGKVTLAGKNLAGFDLRFLELMPGWSELSFRRRVIDPAVLWVDWKLDSKLPNLSVCCDRAGISTSGLHSAVRDAEMVVSLIRLGSREAQTRT